MDEEELRKEDEATVKGNFELWDNGWQPIETAPKDRLILIIDVERDIQILRFGSYYDDEAEMIISGWTPNELIYFIDPEFTHWMPLPAPPQHN